MCDFGTYTCCAYTCCGFSLSSFFCVFIVTVFLYIFVASTCFQAQANHINNAVVYKHCSLSVEFKIIKCRPFYLPREFTAILLVAVYIAPSASGNNRSEALNGLFQHISEQQTAHLDASLVLARMISTTQTQRLCFQNYTNT